jgi:CspA family cold shock protein
VSKEKGKVKFFNVQKGFGFIQPENGKKDLFVHMSNIEGDVRSLEDGQMVEYVKVDGRKGPEAVEVSVLA